MVVNPLYLIPSVDFFFGYRMSARVLTEMMTGGLRQMKEGLHNCRNRTDEWNGMNWFALLVHTAHQI